MDKARNDTGRDCHGKGGPGNGADIAGGCQGKAGRGVFLTGSQVEW